MSKQKYFLGLAFAFLLAVPAFAQQGLRYATDERFAVVNDDAYNDLNVVMAPITYDKLPVFIQTQLTLMSEKCTGSSRNAARIKAYSYESEGARRKRLPPSYILDLLPLANEPMQSCSYPTLCSKGLCALIGFKAIDSNTWSRSFVSLIQSWEVKHRVFPGTTLKQTVFSIRSLAPRCPPDSSGAQAEECQGIYQWTGDRLSLVPMPKNAAQLLTD